jgi:uncharacterized integral membrane protein (TIGR00698 family)
MKIVKKHLLGAIFVAFISLFALFLSSFEFAKSLHLSPLVIGIITGMVIANTFGDKIPKTFDDGIRFSAKKILRVAIVFYGFRITFSQIVDVGAEGFLVSLIMVLSTFIIGSYFGIRFFGLDKDTAMLTASGASVCGAAAVLATEPLLKAKEHKVTVAVAMVVLFGTISMFIYPLFYTFIFSKTDGFLHLSPEQFGIYVGATVHEVAQVVAVSTINGADTSMAHNGVIVKLTRVLLIAPMLILLALFLSKTSKAQNTQTKIAIPWFALYFIAVVGFNSLDILPKDWVKTINSIDTFLLTMAMSALGVGSRFSNFKRLGLAPFYTALVMHIWLIVGGFLVVKGVGNLLG